MRGAAARKRALAAEREDSTLLAKTQKYTGRWNRTRRVQRARARALGREGGLGRARAVS